MADLIMVQKGSVGPSVASRACRNILLINASGLGGFYSGVVRSWDCSKLPVQLATMPFQVVVWQEGKEYRPIHLFGFVKLCGLNTSESHRSQELHLLSVSLLARLGLLKLW